MGASETAMAGADEDVQGWIHSVLEDAVEVSLLPPAAGAPASGKAEVRAYLMALAPAAPSRERAPPFQFAAQYLVTCWAATPAREHDLLGRLVIAALREREVELDLTPPPLELWRAFGVAPRPAFVMRIPVRVERPLREGPPVRERALEILPTTSLVGRVVGEGDVPLAGALVKHIDLEVTTRTDPRGIFRFARVPSGREQRLRVHARGLQRSVAVTPDEGRGEPIVIRFLRKEA